VPRRDHTSKTLRYGTCSQRISQFYLHTPRSSANGMNHTCLFFPSRSWYSFTVPRGMEGWVGLRCWLHTEINVLHRENRTRSPIPVLVLWSALRAMRTRCNNPSIFFFVFYYKLLPRQGRSGESLHCWFGHLTLNICPLYDL